MVATPPEVGAALEIVKVLEFPPKAKPTSGPVVLLAIMVKPA
jgi:hypothetical protein